MSHIAASRRGISLLEVLISIFVITVGLLGLASLVTVGGFTVVEAGKADHAGMCGRAALREIKIRNMLDRNYWSDANPGTGAFAIDPIGAYAGLGKLGGTNGIPRITLLSMPSSNAQSQAISESLAERIFSWADDLQFGLPEDSQPPPDDESTRPRAVVDVTGLPQSKGDFTWFITVTPAKSESNLADVSRKRLYSVSAVVCFKRRLKAEKVDGKDIPAEQSRRVTFLGGVGYGGGSIELNSPIEIDEKEWIMLCDGRHCKWYEVASAGTSPTSMLTLTGPDWDAKGSPNPTAVIVDEVIGVYSTTVEL